MGDRGKSIPADVVKIIPDLDKYPPVIHSAAYQAPVHMPGPVNTAGAEDSPFILPDGRTFYFFFTPDVRIPAEKQLLDGVTGIYKSTKTDAGIWSEPELIVSHFAGEPSLDGAGNLYFVHHFYRDNVMLEADIYFAARK